MLINFNTLYNYKHAFHQLNFYQLFELMPHLKTYSYLIYDNNYFHYLYIHKPHLKAVMYFLAFQVHMVLDYSSSYIHTFLYYYLLLLNVYLHLLSIYSYLLHSSSYLHLLHMLFLLYVQHYFLFLNNQFLFHYNLFHSSYHHSYLLPLYNYKYTLLQFLLFLHFLLALSVHYILQKSVVLSLRLESYNYFLHLHSH